MAGTERILVMNDGTTIPQLGLGVMLVPDGRMPSLMQEAVDIGYRHFDTAAHYGNEADVGEGARRLNIDRGEILITTKLADAMHGYDNALRSFEASEKRLGRIDIFLIHWPQPRKNLYRDSWKAMVRLREEKRVRSIGVCNFNAEQIEELGGDTGVFPVMNQIETHPQFQQRGMRAYHATRGVLSESWSPLNRGRDLDNPIIGEIAARIGRSPAQVILRWHLQNGLVLIPKAADGRHLSDNFQGLGFRAGCGRHGEDRRHGRPQWPLRSRPEGASY